MCNGLVVKKFKHPVIDEWKTVQYIIDHGVGISRFGDGEEKLARNQTIKPQLADRSLAKRLQEIASGDNPKCIIGIPRIFDGIPSEVGTKAHSFWSTMLTRSQYHTIYSSNKQYYSSFISRFDAVPEIKCWEYIDHMKKIWEGRDVVVISGEDIQFCKDPYLLDNCNIIGEVKGPNKNAWKDYNRILSDCLSYPAGTLYLARLGPTATVLSFDLGLKGRQGCDLGHAGMFVNRYIKNNPNEPEWEEVNYGVPGHLKDEPNKGF